MAYYIMVYYDSLWYIMGYALLVRTAEFGSGTGSDFEFVAFLLGKLEVLRMEHTLGLRMAHSRAISPGSLLGDRIHDLVARFRV